MREVVGQIAPRVPILDIGSLDEFNERSFPAGHSVAEEGDITGTDAGDGLRGGTADGHTHQRKGGDERDCDNSTHRFIDLLVREHSTAREKETSYVPPRGQV